MHCFTRSLSSSSGEKREDHLSATQVDSSHNFYDEHRPTHGPRDHLSAPGEKLHPSARRNTKSGLFPPVRQNLRAGIYNPVCQQRVLGQSSNLPFFLFTFSLIFTSLFYRERTSWTVQAPSDCIKSSTSLPDAEDQLLKLVTEIRLKANLISLLPNTKCAPHYSHQLRRQDADNDEKASSIW